ncbi:hypothetical protein E5Q_04081 [Mixia osmundae IAM 14324]|uniref:Uncharacterized protein n=1 Tax=Mixia osmundae (strain CBS 9802 / IAM 14324 / JCM 22182 / KY 12970) TaxID=764103 RepID=G7E3J3_MIXOS|nr:hypothetical protein E5Q_04081 [Mixia osmundae IAM 14324]
MDSPRKRTSEDATDCCQDKSQRSCTALTSGKSRQS